MSPAEPTSFIETLTTIAAGLVLAVFAGQKVLKGWQTNSTESSVMAILHTELERMAEQNTKLALELGKLQIEVVTLNQELRKLTVENQQLHSEVAMLTQEVTRLQLVLLQNRGTNVSTS